MQVNVERVGANLFLLIHGQFPKKFGNHGQDGQMAIRYARYVGQGQLKT